MAIAGIKIRNYKCFKDIDLYLKDNYDLYCLLGISGIKSKTYDEIRERTLNSDFLCHRIRTH